MFLASSRKSTRPSSPQDGGLTLRSHPKSPSPLDSRKVKGSKLSIEKELDLRLSSELNSPYPLVRAQAIEELELRLLKQSPCSSSLLESLTSHSFQVDSGFIAEYLSSLGRFDSNFQESMVCLATALFDKNEESKIWLSEIRLLERGVSGSTFILFSRNEPLFLLKTSSILNGLTLTHEAVIGRFALNSLRGELPTFMQTYTAFLCTEGDPERGLICGSKEERENCNLIIEYIPEALSFTDLLPHLNAREFLEIYLQVLNALQLAFSRFAFTHYDLHGKNVLVQRLLYPVALPFYHNNEVRYLHSRWLARIIDYGYSYAKIEDVTFGIFGMEKYLIFGDKPFPLYDAYRLLVQTYCNVSEELPSETDKVMQKLFSFFSHESLWEIKRKESKKTNLDGKFPVPDLKWLSTSHSEFITFILRNVSSSFLRNSIDEDALFVNDGQIQSSWLDLSYKLFVRQRQPKTLLEFSSASRDPDLRDWLLSVNFQELLEKEQEELDTLCLLLENEKTALTSIEFERELELLKLHIRSLLRISLTFPELIPKEWLTTIVQRERRLLHKMLK